MEEAGAEVSWAPAGLQSSAAHHLMEAAGGEQISLGEDVNYYQVRIDPYQMK